MSKTIRILDLIWNLLKSRSKSLSSTQVQEILGNPSRASWYRILKELTSSHGEIPPILESTNSSQDFFKLNLKDWKELIEEDEFNGFIYYCALVLAKKIGIIESPNLFSFSSNEDKLNFDSKFISLSPYELSEEKRKKDFIFPFLQSIYKQNVICFFYKKTLRKIYPLTLLEYLNSWYLLGKDYKNKEIKCYKLSRIKELTILEETFNYPNKKEWSPTHYFLQKNGVGIIRNKPITAHIKVYNPAKNLWLEGFLSSAICLEQNDSFAIFKVIYHNETEFLGILFKHAECLEIISPTTLRQNFCQKALKSLELNKISFTKKAS